eukprot:270462_1
MSSSVSWSQLLTIAATTFVCTLTGLYIHHCLTSTSFANNTKKQHTKTNKQSKNKSPQSKQKAIDFWDKYHCNESITSEWLADWSELKTFILSQITKVMNHNENRNKMTKSDVKILILGNGLSEIPIHLYNNGYTNLTVTDVSISAINTMKQKHSNINCIKWLVVDCTEMSNIFKDNTFDVIFEKGVSDTLQYRRPSKESNLLLQKMFNGISKLLVNEYGKYLCITPRRKVPLLRLNQFKWTVKRIQIRKCDKYNKDKPFLYLHVCTKIYNKNHLMVMKNQQYDRRKEFEKGCTQLNEMEIYLNFKFKPLIEINNIEKDIIIPFKHYEQEQKINDVNVNECNNDWRLQGIINEINSYYVIHGIIQYKRKFGKKLMFYRVSVINDMNDKKQMLLCVAERGFIAKLNNPKLKQEFATNYLTKCGDEVRFYGKLGLTNKGILSLFVYYVSLIQYHCNWKYE